MLLANGISASLLRCQLERCGAANVPGSRNDVSVTGCLVPLDDAVCAPFVYSPRQYPYRCCRERMCQSAIPSAEGKTMHNHQVVNFEKAADFPKWTPLKEATRETVRAEALACEVVPPVQEATTP